MESTPLDFVSHLQMRAPDILLLNVVCDRKFNQLTVISTHEDIPMTVSSWTSLTIQVKQVLQNVQVALIEVGKSQGNVAACPKQNILCWIKTS